MLLERVIGPHPVGLMTHYPGIYDTYTLKNSNVTTFLAQYYNLSYSKPKKNVWSQLSKNRININSNVVIKSGFDLGSGL